MQLMFPVLSHHLQVIFVTLPSSPLFLPILARTQGIAHYHSVLGERQRRGLGCGHRQVDIFILVSTFTACATLHRVRLLSFSSLFIHPSSQLLGVRSLYHVLKVIHYHVLKVIHRPTQMSPQLFLHRVLLLPDGVGEGCDVQTASSCLFSSQDKEDGSLRMPARAVLLFRLPFPICLSGLSAMEKPIETVCQECCPVLCQQKPPNCPPACMTRLPVISRHPVWISYQQQSWPPGFSFFFSHLYHQVSHGMKAEYLHRSTKKSTHFDKHTLSALTNLIKKFDLHLHFPILY